MIGLGNDHRRFKASKVGTDPGTDVALLKIDENNLPSINFATATKRERSACDHERLKPNEKILMRVYSQGRSGYIALEAK